MLFGRRDKDEAPAKKESQARPILGKRAFCRVCNSYQQFSRCWLRIDMLTKCPCCGFEFPNAGLLYKQFQPVCPRCEEYLEQPGFEYGLCDSCGSKYELVEGTKPGLLPNFNQRQEMNKHGKVRRT